MKRKKLISSILLHLSAAGRYGKKTLVAICATAVLLGSAPAPVRASGADALSIGLQALGVYAVYQSTLKGLISLGRDPVEQMRSRNYDVALNGADDNARDRAIVDRIMGRLQKEGDKMLATSSLPFTWTVNDNTLFNASCYPTNYISVNRGLIRVLGDSEDEVASVLAHEMIHGINQHAAKDYAKAAALNLGASLLNMQAGLVDWGRFNGLMGYTVAKNIVLPSEYEADEKGFDLMVRAGYNPGAPAASMARMAHYLRYETRDINEYEDPDTVGEDNFSDHAETGLREKRLADRMTAYSAGHVTVESGKTVCIDDLPLLSADWTRYDYDNTTENAYLVAGDLARAFHENDSIAGWGFSADHRSFLPGRAEMLRQFVERTGRYDKLYELVTAAYAAEQTSGARAKLNETIAKENADIQKRLQKGSPDDEATLKKMIEGADLYVDLGEPQLARQQLARVWDEALAAPDETKGAAYSVSARTRAALGDYAGGVADAATAVALDGKTVNTLLNSADTKRMAGDAAGALEDALAARALDDDSAVAHLYVAILYDEAGRTSEALEEYRAYHDRERRGYRSIPLVYLEQIDADEAEKIREEEQKEYEEWKKQKESTKE